MHTRANITKKHAMTPATQASRREEILSPFSERPASCMSTSIRRLEASATLHCSRENAWFRRTPASRAQVLHRARMYASNRADERLARETSAMDRDSRRRFRRDAVMV